MSTMVHWVVSYFVSRNQLGQAEVTFIKTPDDWLEYDWLIVV